MLTCDFVTLLGGDTLAARDRMTILCAIAALGREVDEGVLIDHTSSIIPPWSWEVVVHCCADLADGGALERVRNAAGDVVGWRITDEAARWLTTATLCAVASSELSRAPSWMMAMLPTTPKPSTTTSTATRAVTP